MFCLSRVILLALRQRECSDEAAKAKGVIDVGCADTVKPKPKIKSKTIKRSTCVLAREPLPDSNSRILESSICNCHSICHKSTWVACGCHELGSQIDGQGNLGHTLTIEGTPKTPINTQFMYSLFISLLPDKSPLLRCPWHPGLLRVYYRLCCSVVYNHHVLFNENVTALTTVCNLKATVAAGEVDVSSQLSSIISQGEGGLIILIKGKRDI